MVQSKKERKHHVKKSAERDVKPKNNATSRKNALLTKLLPRSRKGIIKVSIAAIVLVAVVGAIPFPHAFAKSVAVDFATENQKNADLELGDSKVLQEGRDGAKVVNIESFQSIWGRLLGLEPIMQKEVSEKIVDKPASRIIAKGSKKYQYMLCTNGSYRSYTDEQFKDPNTGFTSKSEDNCKKNNQGVKLKLADTPSANNQVPPSVANITSAPKDCDSTYIYFMNNFYLSGTKRALDFLTKQNERVFSYSLPKDEEDKEINKNIKYYNDSVTNYYNGLRQSLNDNGCAHKDIGFQPAAVPFR